MIDLFDPHQAGSDPVGLRLRFLPDPHCSRIVRERVFEYARSRGIGSPILDDLMFAIGEAIANAIEHSHSPSTIEVRCDVDDDKIVAAVVDSGRGFDSAAAVASRLPDDLVERGRGLPIMKGFTDIFALRSIPGQGTAVVLGRYVPRPAVAGLTAKETPATR
ncbi:MAG TPA: ATP-binding protein [Candidatus Baltobacteraceae bacterium]